MSLLLRIVMEYSTIPQLTAGGTVLKENNDLDVLGVTFDSKMIFEKPFCSVSKKASQRLGILWKSFRVFHDKMILMRCFRDFVLLVLEYCSAVWCTPLLIGGVSSVSFLIIDLWQYCACCRRPGVTICTVFVVLYLCLM